MTASGHTPQENPNLVFVDGVRVAALDKLLSEYAAAPERHAIAAARAQGLLPEIREYFSGAEEGTPDGILTESALTKLFFTFHNPDDPDDTPSFDQIAQLCVDASPQSPSDSSFAEALGYLYAYSNGKFIGPWYYGTSSADRFSAALERMVAGTESSSDGQ
jgi:hypothetical protein